MLPTRKASKTLFCQLNSAFVNIRFYNSNNCRKSLQHFGGIWKKRTPELSTWPDTVETVGWWSLSKRVASYTSPKDGPRSWRTIPYDTGTSSCSNMMGLTPSRLGSFVPVAVRKRPLSAPSLPGPTIVPGTNTGKSLSWRWKMRKILRAEQVIVIKNLLQKI